MDGTGLDPMDPNRVLKWDRGEPNRFANFDPAAPVVVVRPGGDTTREWGWDEWIKFAGEVGRPFGTVTFANPPAGPDDLAGMTPGDAAVRGVDFPNPPGMPAGDTGADTGRLPRPAGPAPE